MTARRAGVVVAGGRSTRFGPGDKALAELDGRALIRLAVDRLAAVADEVVVNCRAEQVAPLRRALAGSDAVPRFAVDSLPGRGPVAGLARGLAAAEAPAAAAVACDMPHLDPAFLRTLFDDAAGRDGAVPVFEGVRQPLCAVYRTAPCRDACRDALAADDGGLRGVLSRLDAATVEEPTVRSRTPASTFRNVNTRDDLAAAARSTSERSA